MSYGDFEESCPRCGKKTCGDAGNVCLSPDERRWATMENERAALRAKVAKLEEENSKLLEVVNALQFACKEGAAMDFLKNVSQAHNLANKYLDSVK